MNLRRLVLFAGAVVFVIGVIAMLVPVSIAGPDNQRIGCGNTIAANDTEARQADNANPVNLPIIDEIVPHTDYVVQCDSALSQRRTWSIPIAVVGLLLLAGGALVGGRAGGIRTG